MNEVNCLIRLRTELEASYKSFLTPNEHNEHLMKFGLTKNTVYDNTMRKQILQAALSVMEHLDVAVDED